METFLRDHVTLHAGDCLEVLTQIESNSLDACCTDPPYGIGFMGREWDHGVPSAAHWKEVLRVLKPGAHLIAFAGARTYHRMATVIEDAGFEIRDMLMWLYGSGFPKAGDLGKQIDKAAGAEREIVGTTIAPRKAMDANPDGGGKYGFKMGEIDVTVPATEAAREWTGWATQLKPCVEPIVLARKPISEATVALNAQRWRTGALNIDGCRIPASVEDQEAMKRVVGFDKSYSNGEPGTVLQGSADGSLHRKSNADWDTTRGRWPPNVCTDGSAEVLDLFPEVKPGGFARPSPKGGDYTGEDGIGFGKIGVGHCGHRFGDDGSPARFFYTAKADDEARAGSRHPTVKPVDLMQWLVRLVTPPGGTVVDPFAGTGTTGEAAWREGFRAVLIERMAEYRIDIRRRMALCMAGPDERRREIVKARLRDKPVDLGPLFGGAND